MTAPFAPARSAGYPQLMLIDNAWVAAEDGQTFPVINPATKKIVSEAPRAGALDVERAVRAAKKAQPGWAALPARERGHALLRIAEAIDAECETLARSVAVSGIAIRTQARPEVRQCANIFRYFAGVATERKGETLPLGSGALSYNTREPLGVVGAVTPWNAPAIAVALKIAPAICAGNSIVIKVAEDSPLAGLELGRLCARFLPEGVVNVLTGFGAECGSALAAHPGVDKLSFTGSTTTGKSIMRAAAERIVPVSLELGGKSPQIVYADAGCDDPVIDGVMAAMKFTRQTQACSAGTRLFVHESIVETFVERLVEKVQRLKIGDPFDETVDVGSIINKRQFDKVCSYIEDGLSSTEAELVCGGMPPTDGDLAQGFFTVPTVFLSHDNDWRLAQEEIFGPVIVVIPWRDEDEVMRMANASHFGLAAYVWTHDIGKALRAANALQAGWIQINQGAGQEMGQAFGGFKQSGIGREFSLDGMLESYTQIKCVTVNLRW